MVLRRAFAEDGIGDEEVEVGVDVDDGRFGVDEASAVLAEEGVGAGRDVWDFEEEGAAGEGEDGAVGDVGGWEVLSAEGVVVEDVAFPGADGGAAVEAGGPPGMVLAHGLVGLDGVGVGGEEEVEGAIDAACGADGDVAVEEDDGVRTRVELLELEDGVASGVVDAGGVVGERGGAGDGGDAHAGGEGGHFRIVGGEGDVGDARGVAGGVDGPGEAGAAGDGEEVFAGEAFAAAAGEDEGEGGHGGRPNGK